MSGVSPTPGLSGPLYSPTAVPAASAPAPAPVAAAPAMSPDQVALTTGGAAPDLGRLQAMINSGNPVDAAMGLYQLEALAPTMRAQVVPILLSQLSAHAPETSALAAIDMLARMKAPEAAPYLQQLAQSSSPIVRAAAGGAYAELTGQGGTAPAAAPAAAATPVAPNQPLTSPAAPAPAAAAPAASAADLIGRLNDPATAPAAAVELSKMPMAQVLPIVNQALHGFEIDPNIADMLTTIVAKRVREPGAADCLREVLKLYPGRYTRATSKAALALLSLKDPRYVPDLLPFLKTWNNALSPVKRALIDTMARTPALLQNNPDLTAALSDVLQKRESEDLGMAASHALSLIKTKASRDALADSPFLKNARYNQNMRGLWDLAAHPAPYPPAAIELLNGLAVSKDAQVAKLAADLLKKSGKTPPTAKK